MCLAVKLRKSASLRSYLAFQNGHRSRSRLCSLERTQGVSFPPQQPCTQSAIRIVCLHFRALWWRHSLQRRIRCGVSPSLHNSRHETSVACDASRSARIRMGSDDISAQLARFSHIDNTAKASKAKTLVPLKNLTEHIITVIRCKRERSIIRHLCEMIREPPRCGRWETGVRLCLRLMCRH